MDIKLLRAFVTLAQQGRYHAAAQILCLTQPALTKQIQTLEHLTGLRLFLRGRQGAALTSEGQQLYPRACALLKHHDEFSEYVRDIQKGSTGRLALGFGISTFDLAPAKVRAFHQRFPDVDISLNDIPSYEQCQMLLDGRLHAGFVRLPIQEPLVSVALLEERLMLAAPCDAVTDNADLSLLLSRYPLLQISPKRGRGLSEQVAGFLRANRLRPATIADADDIHTLLALVAAGNGIALLPSGASHIVPAGVTLVAVEGHSAQWQVGIAWNPLVQDVVRERFIDAVVQDA